MVDVNSSPYLSVFVNYLEIIGDPADSKRAFPACGQLISTLRRGRHREDETPLLIGVGDGGRRWGSHLLVGQLQPLVDDLHIVGGIIDGRGGVCVLLHIRREGGLPSRGNHRRREPMSFVGHGVERQHDAGNFVHPCLGGRAFEQVHAEHIVERPVTTLVNSILFGVIGRREHPLDPEGAQQLAPYFTYKLSPSIREKPT